MTAKALSSACSQHPMELSGLLPAPWILFSPTYLRAIIKSLLGYCSDLYIYVYIYIYVCMYVTLPRTFQITFSVHGGLVIEPMYL